MKDLNYIFVLILLLFACNRKEDKKADIAQKTEKSKIESSLNADPQKDIEKKESVKVDSIKRLESFDIGNLPSEWIRLTKTDSGMVIYNSCDGGNKLINLSCYLYLNIFDQAVSHDR